MNRKDKNTILCVLVSALLAMPGIGIQAQDACGGPPTVHNLMINVTNNVPTGVSLGNEPADDLYVCPGDTVAWILQGPGFTIDFPADSPFNANQFRPVAAGRVAAVVRDDVAAGEAFKYDISVDGGGVLDPRIIIQD
jgi:hypothetical protein